MTVTHRVSSDGNVEFEINAIAGRTYIVETSTDLINWTPSSTNVASGGVVLFSAPATNFPYQFYRVVSLPRPNSLPSQK